MGLDGVRAEAGLRRKMSAGQGGQGGGLGQVAPINELPGWWWYDWVEVCGGAVMVTPIEEEAELGRDTGLFGWLSDGEVGRVVGTPIPVSVVEDDGRHLSPSSPGNGAGIVWRSSNRQNL
mmetsp:Transcript_18787/g.40322  ORF Transcript_18787/g.40322 Transcript_18787/m.40322 type:complete len:120 (+) Transcript_18787:302-661(+)